MNRRERKGGKVGRLLGSKKREEAKWKYETEDKRAKVCGGAGGVTVGGEGRGKL